jgi:hypothetical protein
MGSMVAYVFLAGLLLVGLPLIGSEPGASERESFSDRLISLGAALIVGDVLFVISYAAYRL